MSVQNVPVGQDAYQAILMQKYAAAWNPFVRSINRYTSGTTGTILATENGTITCMPQMAQRCGPRLAFVPVAGAAAAVQNTGAGTGYVVGDLVTMAPINGGRPIIIRITAAPAGVPSAAVVVDPGSGLLGGGTGVNATTAQTAALTQASTTGVGTGATWTGIISVGLGLGPMPRPDA